MSHMDSYVRSLQDAAVRPLSRVAVSFQSVPRWIEVCSGLEREGGEHIAAGRLGDAYVSYYRLATILLDLLPSHPDYGSPAHTASMPIVARSKADAVTQLEVLQAQIVASRALAAASSATAAAVEPTATCSTSVRSVCAPFSHPLPPSPAAALPGGASLYPVLEQPSSEPKSGLGYPQRQHSAPATLVVPATGASLAPAPPFLAAAAAAGAAPSYADLLSAFERPSTASLVRSLSTSASRGLCASAPGFSPRLRRVFLPGRLVDAFTHLAAPNTRASPRGLETCGVLAGSTDPHGSLVVSHLVLPKQRGGPDHCEMLDEDALLVYCVEKALITLGWIHTHPSQDCFLSSVDLHTHCPYQQMLPEAVAVVVAPTDRNLPFGVFRLTDEPPDPGLQLVLSCSQKGFHPHTSAGPIYLPAQHCTFDDGLPLSICDLR